MSSTRPDLIVGAHQGSAGFRQPERAAESGLVGGGGCLKIDANGSSKRQEGGEDFEAQAAAPDGKDAGWGGWGSGRSSGPLLEHPRGALTVWNLGLWDLLTGPG